MTTCPPSSSNLLSWLRSAEALQCTQDQRNLLWVAASPPLLAPHAETPSDFTFSDTQLAYLCSDPAGRCLHQQLQKNRSHFLGTYYESLWSFLIQACSDLDLVAQNLQVNHDGKTVGEFDFLVQDKRRRRLLHQEVAIKFYLYDPSTQPGRWRGPNARDRLDLKLAKLRDQQLNLSQNPSALHTLREMQLTVFATQFQIQGYLFYPHTGTPPQDESPLHPDHQRGLWYYPAPLIAHLEQRDKRHDEGIGWQILHDKRQWLAPFLQTASKAVMNTEDLLAYLRVEARGTFRPALIVKVAEQKGAWVEQERLFLVPGSWPLTTKPAPTL